MTDFNLEAERDDAATSRELILRQAWADEGVSTITLDKPPRRVFDEGF
jgi:hypothetical protein